MLISNAYAQTAAAAQGPGYEQIFIMLAMFGALWFLMVRPQMKRAKEHKALIEALQKGDEVITQGGVLGRVVKLDENYITIEASENVHLVVQRPAVQVILPKGTLKNL